MFPRCLLSGTMRFRGRGGILGRRTRRNPRARFRPLYRRAVLRRAVGRSRRRGDPHRADRRRRGPLVHPGRHVSRWRRRDVPGDEPQQARHDAGPGRAEGPRDRPQARRDRRCRRRQFAARGIALAGTRSRQFTPHKARHHPDDRDRVRRRRALEPQARFRRHRPGDERRRPSVGFPGAADRAQGALGRFRHRLSVGLRDDGGALRARQDRNGAEGRGRAAAHRGRLRQFAADRAGSDERESRRDSQSRLQLGAGRLLPHQGRLDRRDRDRAADVPALVPHGRRGGFSCRPALRRRPGRAPTTAR